MTLESSLLTNRKAKKEENRMLEFRLYCFFGGCIVGTFSQLGTMCFHFIMISDVAPFQLHSWKQAAVMNGLWSLFLCFLMLCLFLIGRGMVMLSSNDKERAARCLLAMDRFWFLGSVVGVCVSWFVHELVLGTVIGAATTLVMLVIALGLWFLLDHGVMISRTPRELMEDEQGLLMVI
jgi:hypothetical protein